MVISTGAGLLAGAVISGGAALFAGGAQADAASEAAGLSAEATRLSVAEQRRQFDLFRGDLAPYRETGVNALAQYAALYGIGRGRIPSTVSGGAPVEGGGVSAAASDAAAPAAEFDISTVSVQDIIQSVFGRSLAGVRDRKAFRENPTAFIRSVASASAPASTPTIAAPGSPAFLSREEMQAARDRFMETPGYQFRFDEGIRALDRSASATGRLRGGGYTRELTRYGQGVASGEFENYANRLAGIAGMGQGTTVATGTLGVQTGANIGNTLMAGAQGQGAAIMAAGTARASGFAGVGNAVTGGVNNLLLSRALGL